MERDRQRKLAALCEASELLFLKQRVDAELGVVSSGGQADGEFRDAAGRSAGKNA